MIKAGEKAVKELLKPKLTEELKKLTEYITIGADAWKNGYPDIKDYHIELVFIFDIINNKLHWTGKSYPTITQQKRLVRISDIKTHFIVKIMILGCHDLKIFDRLSRLNPKTAKWRRNVYQNILKKAKKNKIIYVLQHPHTTVKIKTWRNAWSGLKKDVPTLKKYVGVGRYYESDTPRSKWDKLDDVLDITKNCNTIDFIFNRKGKLVNKRT